MRLEAGLLLLPPAAAVDPPAAMGAGAKPGWLATPLPTAVNAGVGREVAETGRVALLVAGRTALRPAPAAAAEGGREKTLDRPPTTAVKTAGAGLRLPPMRRPLERRRMAARTSLTLVSVIASARGAGGVGRWSVGRWSVGR